MATAASTLPPQQAHRTRVYSLCIFRPGVIVPLVNLIEADSDDEAIGVARGIGQMAKREVWDRHRLVAVIRPDA